VRLPGTSVPFNRFLHQNLCTTGFSISLDFGTNKAIIVKIAAIVSPSHTSTAKV